LTGGLAFEGVNGSPPRALVELTVIVTVEPTIAVTPDAARDM
jgi:hypothetical protein